MSGPMPNPPWCGLLFISSCSKQRSDSFSAFPQSWHPAACAFDNITVGLKAHFKSKHDTPSEERRNGKEGKGEGSKAGQAGGKRRRKRKRKREKEKWRRRDDVRDEGSDVKRDRKRNKMKCKEKGEARRHNTLVSCAASPSMPCTERDPQHARLARGQSARNNR